MTLECLRAGVKWRVSWVLVVLAVPLGVLIGGHFLAPIIQGPPTFLRHAELLKDVLHQEEPLRMRITVGPRSNLQCTGYVTREFIRDVTIDGVTVPEKQRIALGAPPITQFPEEDYIIVVPTPELEPGQWRFVGRTTYDCGFLLGGIKNYDTPPLHFTVVP